MAEKTLFINGKEVAFDNKKNLLEVIRKAGIDLPTLCYHPTILPNLSSCKSPQQMMGAILESRDKRERG